MRSLRQPLAGVALAGALAAARASAQPLAVAYPPPCDASKVSRSDSERAHAVFLSGKQYLEESSYDKAIGYFNDAYALDCSVHGILPVIATAFERRGDRGEAVRALDEYLRRAPDAPDREVIERRIENLRDQLAREQAAASPPAASAPPPSAAGAPRTAPPLLARAAAGDGASGPRSPGLAPWILAGAGGAAAIAGIVLYAVGAGDISTAQAECGGKRVPCSTAVADKGNGGIAMETAGVVGGGVGVAAVAAGVVWAFIAPVTSSAAGRALGPTIAPGYVGLSMRGAL